MAPQVIATASLWVKSAAFAAFWLICSAIFITIAYLRNGSTGALNRFDEFLFCSIVLVFVGPAVLLGQRLERRLKRRFPVAAPFLAIAATLIPSLMLGIAAAVLTLRNLK